MILNKPYSPIISVISKVLACIHSWYCVQTLKIKYITCVQNSIIIQIIHYVVKLFVGIVSSSFNSLKINCYGLKRRSNEVYIASLKKNLNQSPYDIR